MIAVGQYCERVDPGWFAEPLNTLSALAFLVAAVQIWRHVDRSAHREFWDFSLLSVLVGGAGITAMLWHGSGLPVFFWLNLLVISLLWGLFFTSFLVRLLGFGWGSVFLFWLLGFSIAVLLLSGWLFEPVIEEVGFFLLSALLVSGILLSRKQDPRYAREWVIAGGLLVVAFGFRAADSLLCEWVLVGTHWLWLLLTAGVLYLLVDGLVRTVYRRSLSGGESS